MPANSRPRSRSRDIVQVLFRDKRSMRRSFRASKRASADNGRYSTLVMSPNTTAATALQKSTSNPRQTPEPSFSENPGRPSLTPQISVPLARTSSKVPAIALEGAMIPPIQSVEATQIVDAKYRKCAQYSSSGFDHRRCRESKFGISKSLFSCGPRKMSILHRRLRGTAESEAVFFLISRTLAKSGHSDAGKTSDQHTYSDVGETAARRSFFFA